MYKPYQRNLAANLSVNGFFYLPFHPDLKFFENMRIPQTSLGKSVILTMVHQMATCFLKSSSIAKPLMGLLFDEAEALFQSDPSAFELFSTAPGFNEFLDFESILLHFTRKKNISGALALISTLDESSHYPLFASSLLYNNEYYEVSAALGSYFSTNPESFAVFAKFRFPFVTLMSLIRSELTNDNIIDLLHNHLFNLNNRPSDQDLTEICLELYNFFISFLCDPFEAIVPNQDKFRSRLLAILNYSQRLNPANEAIFERLKVLRKCRFENYHLTEDYARVKTSAIDNPLSEILVELGLFDEALSCLPSVPMIDGLKSIARSREFCQLLVAHNPSWVKTHYASDLWCIFLNKSIMFAFYDVRSFEEWYLSIHQNELMEQFACILFLRAAWLKSKQFFS